MNPFTAFSRFIGTIFSFIGDGIAGLTGNLDARRQKMGRNAYVIDQKFKNVKARKLKNADELLQAIADLEIAKGDLEKEIRDEQEILNEADEMRSGAAGLAKDRVRALNGDAEAAANDGDYQEHKNAYDGYNDTYETAKKRLDGDGTNVNLGLRQELKKLDEDINTYDIQLKSMTKDAAGVDQRKARLIADLRTADAKEKASRRIAGLSQETEDTELDEMERMGQQARARSNVASRLTGASANAQNSKYKAAARRSSTGDSFDALMGFKDKDKSPEPAQPVKLPEN